MDTARFRIFSLFFSFFCPLFRSVIGNPLSCPMIPNKYYRISNQASNFLPMYYVSFFERIKIFLDTVPFYAFLIINEHMIQDRTASFIPFASFRVD